MQSLGAAFTRFVAGEGQYPRGKKTGPHDSFRAENGADTHPPHAVEVRGPRLNLPVLGWVRMREPWRFNGQVQSAGVSRTAARWLVSLPVAMEDRTPVRANQAAGGVALGVSRLATRSDGRAVIGPQARRAPRVRLKRLSRSFARKVKGAAPRHKAQATRARLQARIGKRGSDALHKLTTGRVERCTVIGSEDRNVRGMMAHDRLARSIADRGFPAFRRQLADKAARQGSRSVVADRWHPSSQTGAGCGVVVEAVPLSVRECDGVACGVHHDRDVNAAKNLRKIAGSATGTACGEASAGRGRAVMAKRASVQQASSTQLPLRRCGEVWENGKPIDKRQERV